MRSIPVLLLVASCATAVERLPVPETQVGDRWTYQKLNAHNGNAAGTVNYEVLGLDGEAVRFQISDNKNVTTQTWPRQWNQFELVDGRRFVYDAGEVSGKTTAFNPATNEKVSIKIQTSFLGREKIRVPAGEFDTLKILRNIYIDDREWWKSQTRVRQISWHSPSAAQFVKQESQPSYFDLRRSRHDTLIEGDWNRWVLTDYAPA
ncbi:MAG: hypothetical protein ACREV9_02210 [Burkholderiales bacterium]